ncbi:MAG: hypothetical protein ACP5IM_06575 [Candidatus Bathyarchaeia archaeon]
MSEEKREGIIKNTGILDLKNITEEEIERVKEIENVGVLIIPEKFIGRISAKTKNVGVIAPYKEGMKLYSGKSTIDDNVLKSIKQPMSIINVGKLVIEKKTTSELISQKIEEVRNYGKIIVPKHIYGALMSKISENHGSIEVLEEYIQKRTEELQREIEELKRMSEE